MFISNMAGQGKFLANRVVEVIGNLLLPPDIPHVSPVLGHTYYEEKEISLLK